MTRTWSAIVAHVGAGFSRPELFQASLLDYAVSAIDEGDGSAWRIFFASTDERDRALTDLAAQFPDLRLEPLEVEDEGWAAKSQASITAVQVGHLVIAPPWEAEDRHRAAATTIVIQPSMGFGTGHHATTRLCLAALQQFDLHGRSVLDIGTGSGVLAIAASRLGAAPVIGIDDDPDAIGNARENLGLNPGAAVDFRVADLRHATLGVADVVLANLTGGLLVQAAPLIQNLVSPSGRLVLSGLMAHEETEVRTAFGAMLAPDRTQEDEWLCLVLRRRGAYE